MNLKKSIEMASAKTGIPVATVGKLVGVESSQMSNFKRTGRARLLTVERIAMGFGLKFSEFVALGED